MGRDQHNWFCAQLGAREHYAIPRVLHRQRKLSALATDFWAPDWLRTILQNGPMSAARSLSTRFHAELSDANVLAWNARSIFWELSVRQKARQEPGGVYHGYIQTGRRFATLVRNQLRQRNQTGERLAFFAYDTGALEALEWCREHRVPSVLDQMDPGRFEFDLVRAEEKLWPGWANVIPSVPAEYFSRREREWELADRIVVNSRWSFDALVKQGVPPTKLVVIPLCYEPDIANVGRQHWTPAAGRPLRILFLGQVILRKGIQYLLQAARALEGENVRFDVVGSVGISNEAVNTAPKNVYFHGRATRDQAARWYRESDVFVLPTLSDGFALTQLEAMAYGLPVVATPCCGQVVTDGADGFIVPPQDGDALAGALRRYVVETGLLTAHSAGAIAKSKQFNSSRLMNELNLLENNLNLSEVLSRA